ncbi:MAG: HD domain-containing phosphohydrolase [Desulfovibrionaceae bacterium]
MKQPRRVLFVDDEQYILDSYRSSLRKRYNVETALGPEEGLRKIKAEGPYAVVVSDLKMPGMDGITLLRAIQKLSPDTVRIMLSGHADLDSALSAVNDGAVFRFLTKPTALEQMIQTLEVAIKQYELIVSERELLRGTLRSSIKVLTDILALVNPEAFGRSERVRRLATEVGRRLGLRETLSLDLAAMLSQLGCVTMTDTVLAKVYSGEDLSSEERQVYDMHPFVTAGMVAQIPRMKRVAHIIQHQNDNITDNPDQSMESRILKVCLDFDMLVKRGLQKPDAMVRLRERADLYDAKVMDALELVATEEGGFVRRRIPLASLRVGMVLAEPFYSLDGVHLVAEGTEVTRTALLRIANFMKARRVPKDILVLQPVADGTKPAAAPDAKKA